MDVGFIPIKIYGDLDRWSELAVLNDLSLDKPYWVGEYFTVFGPEA
ncbi:MAG: hypothetical protein OXH47_02970 [Paracoccaceae bacterium]|nr:hypothetical protein [Paracoccaceae bacterium]